MVFAGIHELELILTSIPIIITSLAAAIAGIIAAKHGAESNRKITDVQETLNGKSTE